MSIVQQLAPHTDLGRMDRHVQRRQPLVADASPVGLAQVGQRQEIAPHERIAIVVVEDVQARPQTARQAADEAELAVVVALADAARHGLDQAQRGGLERLRWPQREAFAVAVDDHAPGFWQLELQVDKVARDEVVDGYQAVSAFHSKAGKRRIGIDRRDRETTHAGSETGTAPRARARRTMSATTSGGGRPSVSIATASAARAIGATSREASSMSRRRMPSSTRS